MKSAETSSERGIVYPEDIELQGDSDSDKGVRTDPRVSRHMTDEYQQGRTHYISQKLGLQPEVKTEIATGIPPSPSMRADRGIEVKRDFVVTKGSY
jgi:hypothetical protein